MFAAVRINDFIVGQFNDKCAFGSDCLSGRAELFGQVVPADRLCGKSRGQLSGDGADTDGSVLFFFPDPGQRTPQQLDNFFAQKRTELLIRLPPQNTAQRRMQNCVHAFGHLASGNIAQLADIPLVTGHHDNFHRKFGVVLF